MKLLDIEVPVISAINGPAWRHSDPAALRHRARRPIPRNSRIRRISPRRSCPGDGMHIVYPLLLGLNRGRYFLLTGQTLDAQKAHEFGLVAEVHPADKVLARAWEIAEDLAKKPTLALRYTRLLLTEALRRQMHDSARLRARHGIAGARREAGRPGVTNSSYRFAGMTSNAIAARSDRHRHARQEHPLHHVRSAAVRLPRVLWPPASEGRRTSTPWRSAACVFDRAYVQSPICGPSRMSFYTGRYMRSHGANWNGFPLRVGEPTLGDHLAELGVRTVLVGKTHMAADLAG